MKSSISITLCFLSANGFKYDFFLRVSGKTGICISLLKRQKKKRDIGRNNVAIQVKYKTMKANLPGYLSSSRLSSVILFN